jgi:ParB/RepB/Spo0J family partition protein
MMNKSKVDPKEKRGRGRPPKQKDPIEFKDVLEKSGTELVDLKDIDTEDRSFQYRVTERVSDLISSISQEGQLLPVILWGQKPPFKIIDGYRRVKAIQEIEWDKVRAIIRRDISEDDAYRLSFVENVKRKNFKPIDIANAVWKSQQRGKKNEDLEEEFDLSKRQIQRYKALLEFNENVLKALKEDKITMAHAQVFNTLGVTDISKYLDQISAGMSAQALKRAIQKEMKPKRKPKTFFRKEKDGFRIFPMRYSEGMKEIEKKKIVEVLKQALEIVEGKK